MTVCLMLVVKQQKSVLNFKNMKNWNNPFKISIQINRAYVRRIFYVSGAK